MYMENDTNILTLGSFQFLIPYDKVEKHFSLTIIASI